MKAETLERPNILILLCDIFTIIRGWGRKAGMKISNTYVFAKKLLTSIKV